MVAYLSFYDQRLSARLDGVRSLPIRCPLVHHSEIVGANSCPM